MQCVGVGQNMKQGGIARMGGAALLALSLVLAPAFAASSDKKPKKKSPSLTIGGFTPAVADPKLAAAFAQRGMDGGSFRFTPSTASSSSSKSVKVAVRARAATAAQAVRTAAAEPTPAALSGLTPTAYNLGVSVGWKRFALSGDVAKIEGGILPDGREAAGVGISYSGKKFTGRVRVAAERSDGQRPRVLADEESYSLDVGGSYSIAKNLSLTGGVRYEIERDRLQSIVDDRRDSQAVYVGTAFRF